MFYRLIIVMLLVVLNVHSASWYVDNAATGSSNGTSWVNAWTTFGAIEYGLSKVHGGDTVYMSGGTVQKVYTNIYTTYGNRHIVHAEDGGTEGNPIRFTVGTDSGHNGVVVFDGQCQTNEIDYIVYNGFSNIIFDGGPNTNILIANLICMTIPLTNDPARGRGLKIGYFGGTSKNHLVSRIVVSNVNNGISFNGASPFEGIEIASNRVVKIIGDACIAAIGTGTGFDKARIHHNYIESILDDNGTGIPPSINGGPDGFSGWSGCSIYNNEFKCTFAPGWLPGVGQHPDAVQLYTQANYTKIYNNYFHAWHNSVFEIDYEDNTHDFYCFNNVFHADDLNTGPGRKLAENNAGGDTITDIYWWNNTFVGFNISGYPWGWSWNKNAVPPYYPQPIITKFGMWNNIWYNCGEDTVVLFGDYVNTNISPASIDFAYNLLHAGAEGEPGGSTNVAVGEVANPKGAGRYLWTQLNPIIGAPLFESYAYYTPSAATGLRLTAGSPGIGAGTNLTAFMELKGLTVDDYSGRGRPASAAWTVGAFEYDLESDEPGPIRDTSSSVGILRAGTLNSR